MVDKGYCLICSFCSSLKGLCKLNCIFSFCSIEPNLFLFWRFILTTLIKLSILTAGIFSAFPYPAGLLCCFSTGDNCYVTLGVINSSLFDKASASFWDNLNWLTFKGPLKLLRVELTAYLLILEVLHKYWSCIFYF